MTKKQCLGQNRVNIRVNMPPSLFEDQEGDNPPASKRNKVEQLPPASSPTSYLVQATLRVEREEINSLVYYLTDYPEKRELVSLTLSK